MNTHRQLLVATIIVGLARSGYKLLGNFDVERYPDQSADLDRFIAIAFKIADRIIAADAKP